MQEEIIEEIVEIDDTFAVTHVLSTKRESDHSAELPDALDTTLPTSFEPEMFKSDREPTEESRELEEKDEGKIRDIKEIETDGGESSSQPKKHSHHHHSKVKLNLLY